MQYGVVVVDGVQYVERAQIFPATVNVTQNYQVITQARIALPGIANFLLKGLTREVTIGGVSSDIRFLFRLGNSDGATWYFSGGIGAPSNRVIDTCCMGTAQFPYVIIPPVTYSAAANIQYEIEDISGQAPYVINLAFHGAYLIPTQASVQPSAG